MFKLMTIVAGLAVVAASFGSSLAGGQRAEAAYQTITYMGTVLVNGQAPSYGGALKVYTWSGIHCGTGTVYAQSGSAFFIIGVHTDDSVPGCFVSGDPMIFKFNGMKAQEIPSFDEWGNGFLLELNFKAPRYFQCTPPLCPISSQPVYSLPPGAN